MYITRLAQKYLQSLLKDDKVIIVLGARQVGKTTMLEPFIQQSDGLSLNCDVSVDKARILAASSVGPFDAMKLLGNPKLLVIDEAQNLPEIGRIVKGWYDARVVTKIILLGSSSLDLLDHTAEPLTGRNEKLHLTPIMFSELLKIQPWYVNGITNSMLRDQFSEQVQTLLQQQMVYGGYPETITTKNKEKYLSNITADYLLKDVLHGGLVKSPNTVKRLLELLAYQIGSEVSVSELANATGLSRPTIENYLDLLERSYVIFRLRAYSTNQRKEISKSTKVYFWDTGVRNAILTDFSQSLLRADIGALFENWAIAEVAKRNLLLGDGRQLYFWRRSEGSEVDLVIKGTNYLKAYEFKWSKQNTTKGSKSFTNTYNIPVEIITKKTITKLGIIDEV